MAPPDARTRRPRSWMTGSPVTCAIRSVAEPVPASMRQRETLGHNTLRYGRPASRSPLAHPGLGRGARRLRQGSGGHSRDQRGARGTGIRALAVATHRTHAHRSARPAGLLPSTPVTRTSSRGPTTTGPPARHHPTMRRGTTSIALVQAAIGRRSRRWSEDGRSTCSRWCRPARSSRPTSGRSCSSSITTLSRRTVGRRAEGARHLALRALDIRSIQIE